MKLTIRAKLLIGFTLLLILSFAVQAIALNITREYISSLSNTNQSLEAKKGALQIQNFFTNINELTFGLARAYKDHVINASDSASVSDFRAINLHTIDNNVQISKITYLAPSSKHLQRFDIHGQVSQDDLNYEVSSDAFAKAKNGKTSISKVYFLEQSLGPHLDIFSPIFDNTHQVRAIIKMQIKLESLRKKLETITYGERGFLYVVDNDGRLITHPSQEYVIQRPNLMSRKIITSTAQNKQAPTEDETYVNEKGITVMAKAEKVPGINWIAIIEQPLADANAYATFLSNLFISTSIGALLFLLLVSFYLSVNLTKPILRLKKDAEKIEKKQTNTMEIIKTGDEIEALSRSFASMVNQLLLRESSIKKENQEMMTLQQALSDAVIGLDSEFRIIAFNRATENITGIKAEQARGKHINEVLLLYSEHERIFFDAYSDKTPSEVEKFREDGLHMTTISGEKRTISLTTSPVLFEDKKAGYILAFHDMTKEHELEEMKLDFVSMAAHELRTPLTAIRGYASILQQQKLTMLDITGQEMLKRLSITSENLSSLIDNLLSVSRIERNMFSIEKKPTKIDVLVSNVVETIKNQTTLKKQQLIINVQSDLPMILADPFRITQVILNLVANASNYTFERGTITVDAVSKDGFIQLSVSDTGQGIPQEVLSKLFTKFFRVSGTLEQGSKGTGLGLYISKSIIEMHNGKIWVESEFGKGSKFIFQLPAADDDAIKKYNEHAPSVNITQSITHTTSH
jgi:PAS domain S-box-containing protein